MSFQRKPYSCKRPLGESVSSSDVGAPHLLRCCCKGQCFLFRRLVCNKSARLIQLHLSQFPCADVNRDLSNFVCQTTPIFCLFTCFLYQLSAISFPHARLQTVTSSTRLLSHHPYSLNDTLWIFLPRGSMLLLIPVKSGVTNYRYLHDASTKLGHF